MQIGYSAPADGGAAHMWEPMHEAADRLGVSVDTVRRRVKSGQLIGRKEPTASGFRWLIELPDPDPSAAPAAPMHGGSTDSETTYAEGETAALRALVTVLERELAQRNAELDARRREVSELHILLQRSQGTLLPPQNTPAAPAAPPQTHRRPPPPRSWWRRLTGG